MGCAFYEQVQPMLISLLSGWQGSPEELQGIGLGIPRGIHEL